MDVDGLIRDGYAVGAGAFNAATAARCRDEIWAALAQTAPDLRRDDPSTWTRPLDSPAGFRLDGTNPSPVARAIVAGLGDSSQLRPEPSEM